jgi:hypothetical protein
MVLYDKLAERVFGTMKGFGHQLRLYTVDGSETIDPSVARRFFATDSGAMVTIDEESNEIKLSKSNSNPLADTKKLQQNIKKLANEYLMNYTVRNYGKSIQPRDFSYQAKNHRNNNMTQSNAVAEGLSKLSGSKKTSHQTLENVRILVKHKQEVQEEKHGARSRNIQAVFLEQGGERFRFPHNNLSGARAMARHMYNGGAMSDAVGSYIIERVGQLIQLTEFYRYARSNNLINEDTSGVVETVRESIEGVKTELKRLSGAKTYEAISSRIQEQGEVELNEDDTASLRDMFTVKKFDEKFAQVLPTVSRLVQEKNHFLTRIEEASSAPIILRREGFSTTAILEFSSSMAKLGYKLSEISTRIVENEELSSYISTLGHKLCKEGQLTTFEKSIVSNVLNNVQPQQVAESNKREMTESTQFEKYFSKYNYIFV